MVAVAGWTSSGNFPARNASQPGYGGGDCRFYSYDPCGDAFVAKIDPKASRVAYATYLGGPGSDFAQGIAADDAGNTYVAGYASQGFPVRGPSRGGAEFDAFVTKLSPEGAVVFSTLLGGPGIDGANGIALDREGNILIAGTAMAGFPVTTPGQPQTPAGQGAFVAKLDPAGALLQATFLGGETQVANGIAAGPDGNVYVAGAGKEGPPRTPARPGQRPSSDAFAAKLNSAGALAYTRWLGGPADDDANAIAADASGNAYIAGSAGRGFPTRRALRERNARRSDAFLAKLDSKGTVVFSTFLGGSRDDAGNGVTIGPEGTIYITGQARDGFPSAGSMQPEKNGHTDAFLAAFGEDDGRPFLRYSTLLGGSGREFAQAVATRTGDPVFIAGHTDSRSDFPTLSAFQPTGAGQVETFLTAVSSRATHLPVITALTPRSGPSQGGTRVSIQGKNLARARSVVFGNRRVTAKRTGGDGTRITVRPPPGRQGRVPVKVEAAEGTSGATPGSTFEYAEGVWTPLPASPRYHHAASPLTGGRVLLVGGCTRPSEAGACDFGAKLAQTEILDSKTGKWTPARSPFRGPAIESVAASIPQGTPRTCGRNCGSVLLVSLTRSGFDARLFDPSSGTWKRLRPPKPAQIGGHTLTPLPSGPRELCGENCGRILLIKHSGGGAVAAFGELFDPKTEKWIPIATGRGGALDRSAAVDQQLKSLARVNRSYHTATLLKSGRVLFVGGIGLYGATLAPAEIYDPVSNTLVPTGPPAVTRYGGHTATLMNDGKVLIAGGMTDNIGTFTFSTEIFDPDAAGEPARPAVEGAFSAGPSLIHGRYGHAAAALPGGSVVLAGGVDSTGVPTQRGAKAEVGNALHASEILRPVTNRWTSAGSMAEGRGAAILLGGLATSVVPYFTATPIPDGRLVVAGGRTAEIYSPEGTPPNYEARLARLARQRSDRGWLALAAGTGLAGLMAGLFVFRRRGGTRNGRGARAGA